MYWPNVRMLGTQRDVMRDINRLQREMDRLFSGYPLEGKRRWAEGYPAVNLYTTGDDVVVQAEVPGYEPKDLDITVQGDTLTLKGSRPAQQGGDNQAVHRRERVTGEFLRTLELPCMVDVNAVQANCKNGVLKVVLPRAEEEKPKSITIKAD